MGESKIEYVKRRTLELYDMLPQEEEARKAQTHIRDEIIDLNYSFFGYVASKTFINDPMVTYEDKLQSALLHFTECWWWYKYAAKYRTDLAFTVFFKPRLGEMIERELNIVKYSIRRTLCMEVGAQLGKHWGQVKYEDLAKVKLSPDKMQALQFIFGAMYPGDLEQYEIYIPGKDIDLSEERYQRLLDDKFDTLEELMMSEMLSKESKLSDNDLKLMSKIYDIDIVTLKQARAVAESQLYARLKELENDE